MDKLKLTHHYWLYEISAGRVVADHIINDWCSSEPEYVIRVGHFNDDNYADLLCDDTVNGMFTIADLRRNILHRFFNFMGFGGNNLYTKFDVS